MKTEKKLIKRPVLLFITSIVFVLLSILVSIGLLTSETLVTDWEMEVVGQNSIIEAGQVTDIQIFLENENGEPLTNANVSLIMDMPEMVHYIEKTMHHVENGLYEAEVILSMGGTWIGWVEAKVGNNVYYNQFIVEADGPLVPDEHRDPNDHFHLEQSLPNWLRSQVE